MIGDILQPTHLIFILVIALLVLGPKRLPEVGRSLGRGLRDFRLAMSGDDDRDRHDEVVSPSAVVTPAAPVETPQPAREPAEHVG
jgi:sec-independent protein translocase protein TatA